MKNQNEPTANIYAGVLDDHTATVIAATYWYELAGVSAFYTGEELIAGLGGGPDAYLQVADLHYEQAAPTLDAGGLTAFEAGAAIAACADYEPDTPESTLPAGEPSDPAGFTAAMGRTYTCELGGVYGTWTGDEVLADLEASGYSRRDAAEVMTLANTTPT